MLQILMSAKKSCYASICNANVKIPLGFMSANAIVTCFTHEEEWQGFPTHACSFNFYGEVINSLPKLQWWCDKSDKAYVIMSLGNESVWLLSCVHEDYLNCLKQLIRLSNNFP